MRSPAWVPPVGVKWPQRHRGARYRSLSLSLCPSREDRCEDSPAPALAAGALSSDWQPPEPREN